MGKHCMVGLDYEESCNESDCPLLNICRRISYSNKNRRENEFVFFSAF